MQQDTPANSAKDIMRDILQWITDAHYVYVHRTTVTEGWPALFKAQIVSILQLKDTDTLQKYQRTNQVHGLERQCIEVDLIKKAERYLYATIQRATAQLEKVIGHVDDIVAAKIYKIKEALHDAAPNLDELHEDWHIWDASTELSDVQTLERLAALADSFMRTDDVLTLLCDEVFAQIDAICEHTDITLLDISPHLEDDEDDDDNNNNNAALINCNNHPVAE